MAKTVLMCLSGLGALIVLTLGIWCLVRFAKTRQRRFLILGILLTFVVPGVLGLVAAKRIYEKVVGIVIVYAPLEYWDH